jgi:hypothetical protein
VAHVAPIDVNLDAPLYVAAGTFVHVILRMPVGNGHRIADHPRAGDDQRLLRINQPFINATTTAL